MAAPTEVARNSLRESVWLITSHLVRRALERNTLYRRHKWESVNLHAALVTGGMMPWDFGSITNRACHLSDSPNRLPILAFRSA